MKTFFDHEKLDVYREAIAFVAWAEDLLQEVSGNAAVKDQLDRASTSIPLNIVEGNGKFSLKDRARFLEFARGSALECAACLDVLVAKKRVKPQRVEEAKERLARVVRMLMGLLDHCGARVREEPVGFEQDQEYEQEQERERQ